MTPITFISLVVELDLLQLYSGDVEFGSEVLLEFYKALIKKMRFPKPRLYRIRKIYFFPVVKKGISLSELLPRMICEFVIVS